MPVTRSHTRAASRQRQGGTLHQAFYKPAPPPGIAKPDWVVSTYGGPSVSDTRTMTVTVGLTSETDFTRTEVTQTWATLVGGRMLLLWNKQDSKITHTSDPSLDWCQIGASLFFSWLPTTF